MPIDTSIQFNGHNSYRVTETVWSYPFSVEGMAYITHSFNAFATSVLGSTTRARTRFFADDGSIVGTTDHSFAVTPVFTEVDITVDVPATAVLCQLAFLTSGTWWMAEPKSEEGQTATPYNTNYAGQLTFITQNGIYTGGLTASQIVVVGTLANPSENLGTRLVTINNNAINLSATSATHGNRLTSIEAGVITLGETDTAHGSRLTTLEAGVITLGETDTAHGSRLTTIEAGVISLSETSDAHGEAITNIAAGWITISGSSSFASGYDPTTKETPDGAQSKVNALGSAINAALGELAYDDLVMTAMTRETIIVGGHLSTDLIDVNTLIAQMILTDSLIAKRISNQVDPEWYGEIGNFGLGGGKGLGLTGSVGTFCKILATVDGATNGFAFYDINNIQRILIQPSGAITLSDQDSHARFALSSDGVATIYDTAGFTRLTLSGTYNYSTLRAFNGASYNEIGVDGTGPYIIIAGVKTYITAGGSGGDQSGWDKSALTLDHPAYKTTVHISGYPDSDVVLEPFVDYWTSPYVDGDAAPVGGHLGWDCYSLTSHAPIYAVADGYVYEAHDFVAGMYGAVTSGIYVAIRTAGCIGCHSTTVYKHLNSRAVNTSDSITAGQLIGYQGTTGNSNGEHLHFELFINYYNYDPIEYLLGIKPWQIGT